MPWYRLDVSGQVGKVSSAKSYFLFFAYGKVPGNGWEALTSTSIGRPFHLGIGPNES